MITSPHRTPAGGRSARERVSEVAYWLGCGVSVRGVDVLVGTVAMGSPGCGVTVHVATTGGMGLVKVKGSEVQIALPRSW